MNMGVSGIIGILMVVGLVVGMVGWAAYAYRNPHSASGQILIRVRIFLNKFTAEKNNKYNVFLTLEFICYLVSTKPMELAKRRSTLYGCNDSHVIKRCT